MDGYLPKVIVWQVGIVEHLTSGILLNILSTDVEYLPTNYCLSPTQNDCVGVLGHVFLKQDAFGVSNYTT